jgi:hypothetical protein
LWFRFVERQFPKGANRIPGKLEPNFDTKLANWVKTNVRGAILNLDEENFDSLVSQEEWLVVL